MYPRWALFCAVLPLLAVCSGPDNCTLYESSFHGVSPELESLLCYNDYKSHISCQWEEEQSTQSRTPLELWNWNPYEERESLCEPSGGASVTPDHRHHHRRLSRCRFNTSLFAIAINHTFFFKTTPATSCSSFRHSLDLSERLTVRPPVGLSVRAREEGPQLIQWSSPYPASPSLGHNLTYQLSYRREGRDTWTMETLTETHLNLTLLPGCWYEAQVRAMGKPGGLWSEWSPLVVWKTPEDADQIPSMQCVLDGEEKVTCSWELRKELAHFITYQLACRHKHTHTISRCCVHPKVTPVSHHSEALLRYSCSLTSSHPEDLKLELIPLRNAKSFQSYKHTRPNPPIEARVEENGGNWIVKWEKPNPNFPLSYQVRYWNPLNEKDTPHLQNISEGLTSLTITGASLSPSQLYRMQVRALLSGSSPSEWTEPEEWISHAGPAWSPETFLYVSLSGLAATLFLALFFSVQACRRKLMAWLMSSPSPDKSQLFLENKNLSCSHVLLQKENMDVCRVSHLDSFSSCSSAETPPDKQWCWQMSLSEDEGCLDCDHQTSRNLGDQIICSDTSAVSFNGPYIFCKGPSEPPRTSVDDQQEVKDKDAQPGSDYVLTAPLTEQFAPTASCFRDDYVFLPNPGLSKSTEELVTHGNHNNNNTTEVDGSEMGGQDTEEEDRSQTKLGQSGPSHSSMYICGLESCK